MKLYVKTKLVNKEREIYIAIRPNLLTPYRNRVIGLSCCRKAVAIFAPYYMETSVGVFRMPCHKRIDSFICNKTQQ